MDDLKQLFLEDLIETALRERLIDACESRDHQVVIVQGTMRVVLNPVRAHAFLRGVIQGMSRTRFHPTYVEQAYGRRVARLAPATEKADVPAGREMVDSFRKHLLGKWTERYAQAGAPLGEGARSLMLWVQHNTSTTAN